MFFWSDDERFKRRNGSKIGLAQLIFFAFPFILRRGLCPCRIPVLRFVVEASFGYCGKQHAVERDDVADSLRGIRTALCIRHFVFESFDAEGFGSEALCESGFDIRIRWREMS